MGRRKQSRTCESQQRKLNLKRENRSEVLDCKNKKKENIWGKRVHYGDTELFKMNEYNI